MYLSKKVLGVKKFSNCEKIIKIFQESSNLERFLYYAVKVLSRFHDHKLGKKQF